MMKLFLKMGYLPALIVALMSAPLAHAATTPSLGAAASYGVLSNTYTNTVPGTTINGDVGFTTGPAVVPGGTHANYGSGAPYAQAGIDQGSALTALNAQSCTFTFAPGAIDLSTDITHGPVAVYTPGVYCVTGAMTVGGPLTLSGSGTYIFRSSGALNSTAGAIITSSGASACDVFWTPGAATTLGANTTFIGTIIDNAGITVGSATTWSGRALTFSSGTVTTDTTTLSVPVCTTPVVPSAVTTAAPIIHVTKVPTPLALPNGPGSVTYNYVVTNPSAITLTDVTLVDNKCSAMTFTGGDLNNNAQLETNEAWTYSCTTNLAVTTVNFATARGIGNGLAAVDTAIAQVNVGVPVVPPLINIVKTPSPLSLPIGGGSVTYSYTVTNPGTVALNNVTVTDDKCSNVTIVSGDSNGNGLMESMETWHYTCTTTISTSTVNTAIATGHANGLTAIDTAIATVLVAGAPVPPLIHIIKMANPIILPAAGGSVNYTFTVTNPGTITLDNVTVADDRCGPVTFVGGDANNNGLMEVSETWTYSCQRNLTASTVNTATATGHGNGLTVTDISAASVVLAPALIPPAPSLPNTGVEPASSNAWTLVLAGMFLVATLLIASTQWKKSAK